MKKLRVGLDMDGVPAALLPEWLKRYNEDFNDNLTVEQINLWNWHSLTKDKDGERLYTYLDDQELFRSLPVMPDSQDVIKKYHKDIDFWIVTACWNINNAAPKTEWLLEHFPFLDREKFMFVRDKSGFYGDILIDDKPKNLEGFRSLGILFDAPHNQDENRFIRVNNWEDLDKIFDNLLKHTMKG